MLFFPHPFASSLFPSSYTLRSAHTRNSKVIFRMMSSSRKATTSGVGVARSVLKRRRWRTQWWRRSLRQVRRNERTRVVRFLKEGVRSETQEERNAHRRPNDLLRTNDRLRYHLFFITYFRFPSPAVIPFPVPFLDFPYALSLTVIFSTTNKRTLNE